MPKIMESFYKKTFKPVKVIQKAKRKFHTDTCTREELIKRCKEKNLSEENINIAIEFFINKTKQSKLAEMLSIEEKSVQQRKRRLKQKLNAE